jgi:hypothetical protein
VGYGVDGVVAGWGTGVEEDNYITSPKLEATLLELLIGVGAAALSLGAWLCREMIRSHHPACRHLVGKTSSIFLLFLNHRQIHNYLLTTSVALTQRSCFRAVRR